MTEGQEQRWICPECGLVPGKHHLPVDENAEIAGHPNAEPYVPASKVVAQLGNPKLWPSALDRHNRWPFW